MEWLYLSIIILLAAALAGLAWRYFGLRRRLNEYAREIHRLAEADAPPGSLPLDIPGLEELAISIAALRDRLTAESASLGSERDRLAAILEQMTDAVLIADPQGRVQFANPAAQKLGGVSPMGRSITEVLRHHRLIAAWRRALESGESQVESVELPATRQFIQLIAIPDRYAPGGSLLLLQDLTRLRRLETVRRDFVSNLSHELRTPLASVKALAETLEGGALEDPPAARHFLGLLVVEVEALSRLVSDLLELSRIESGQFALELKPVDPCEALASAAERMQMQAERAGLTLDINCLASLPRVRADASRVEQVLVNLIHNAIQFTPAGGRISLSASTEDGMLRMAVKDTGEGIAPEDLPRIFERFYKSDRSRTGGGTGLGLAIVRHLVELHGGRIWAESEVGQGSTFFFSLPLA